MAELSRRINGLARERQQLWLEMAGNWSADAEWRVLNITGLLEDAYAEKRQAVADADGRASAKVEVGSVVRGLRVEGVGSWPNAR
jgi:hypothetical protein